MVKSLKVKKLAFGPNPKTKLTPVAELCAKVTESRLLAIDLNTMLLLALAQIGRAHV
jgi:hypothetical protein